MADFQLQLDVIAQTVKLEQGLKKAEAAVSRSAKKMDAELNKIDAGESAGAKIGNELKSSLFGAVGAGALAAGIQGAVSKAAEYVKKGAREDGAGIGTAIMEGVVEGLSSVPIVGPVGEIIGGALGAYDFEQQQERRKKLIEEQAAAERRRAKALLEEQVIQDQLIAQEEERARASKEAHDAWIEWQNEVLKQNKMVEDSRREAGDKEYELLNRFLRAQNDGNEEALRDIEQQEEMRRLLVDYNRKIQDALAEENGFLASNLEQQRDILAERLKQVQAAEDQALAMREQEEIAARQAEAQRVFNEQRLQAEQEIAAARAEAELQVAGATATFSTAGGSFTAGISAQVNEAKLLTTISQQSRDFLAQIVQNTMSLPGVLSLG